MIHRGKIVISRKEDELIRSYLNAKNYEEFQPRDDTISETFVFDDGNEMDVKCCGCGEDPSWCEAVLFDKDGHEICHTDVYDGFTGEWHIEVGTDEYIVDVEAVV